jgi:hypothetical protein
VDKSAKRTHFFLWHTIRNSNLTSLVAKKLIEQKQRSQNMDQAELNRVAISFLRAQAFEVADKLRQTLIADIKKRSVRISGVALHHIHNMAMFECLMWLNSQVALGKDASKETVDDYVCLTETLRPKFQEIVNTLKDFQPAA